jgi:hypothetical protein
MESNVDHRWRGILTFSDWVWIIDEIDTPSSKAIAALRCQARLRR